MEGGLTFGHKCEGFCMLLTCSSKEHMYKNASAQQNHAVTTESISDLTGKHEIPISSKEGL